MERLGRKRTMLVGNALTAIGIGVQIGSHGWKVFLVGRLINGASPNIAEADLN